MKDNDNINKERNILLLRRTDSHEMCLFYSNCEWLYSIPNLKLKFESVVKLAIYITVHPCLSRRRHRFDSWSAHHVSADTT